MSMEENKIKKILSRSHMQLQCDRRSTMHAKILFCRTTLPSLKTTEQGPAPASKAKPKSTARPKKSSK